MDFRMALLAVKPPPRIGSRWRDYDPFSDTVVSILSDLCEVLEDHRVAKFIVGGFGQESWPVDVRTDLPVVLEQLPGLYANLRAGPTAVLDFYEQGIQRRLEFRPTDGAVQITCFSYTDWQPDRPSVPLAVTALWEMLNRLRNEFIGLAGEIDSAILGHALMEAWVEDTELS